MIKRKTVIPFRLIMNQTKFPLVHDQKENCFPIQRSTCGYVPFNGVGNDKFILVAYTIDFFSYFRIMGGGGNLSKNEISPQWWNWGRGAFSGDLLIWEVKLCIENFTNILCWIVHALTFRKAFYLFTVYQNYTHLIRSSWWKKDNRGEGAYLFVILRCIPCFKVLYIGYV